MIFINIVEITIIQLFEVTIIIIKIKLFRFAIYFHKIIYIIKIFYACKKFQNFDNPNIINETKLII